MDEQVALLREMRDLLRVIAEPALAKRDEELRAALTELVGRSRPKAKAVLLMDGSRSQHPELVISIPPNFFERSDKQDG